MSDDRERFLSNPSFWKHCLFMLYDEKLLREFAEVSQIPVENIKATRRRALADLCLRMHEGTDAIN